MTLTLTGAMFRLASDTLPISVAPVAVLFMADATASFTNGALYRMSISNGLFTFLYGPSTTVQVTVLSDLTGSELGPPSLSCVTAAAGELVQGKLTGRLTRMFEKNAACDDEAFSLLRRNLEEHQ